MKFKLTYIIIFLATICFSHNLSAQASDSTKVGLVLSGGGAKGFAHIGVLKVIDSLGIKVDYIAGTSMGAIIGSLYASGYSGKQLDSIFRTIDFDVLINDKFQRKSKSLIERNNSERYAINLPIDGFKLKLPSGLSRGQNVYNLLYKLLLPVNEVSDFSKLPTPFFCIATNIETGEPILMDKGNLAEAVTASGAFPSLFQPVKIKDKIYVDGGVTNNYPINELRAKGVDVIIGVDVQDGLKDREELESAPEILLQINNFRTINDMKVKRKQTDIYIKPDITNFSVISFSEGRDIVKAGEAAAKKELTALVNLKKTQPSFYIKDNVRIADSLKIADVILKGNKRYTRSYILGKLKLRGNDNISYEQLNEGINNLVATNNFDAVRYKLAPTKSPDVYNFEADINESKANTFVKLGLHYDGLYKSAALLNITRKRLVFNNDFASLDIILGDNLRYDFDYFIDKGFYISIGLKSRYNQFDRLVNANLLLQPDDPLLVDLNKVDVELQDQTNQLYFQTLLAKEFEFNLGFEHKRLKITTETLNNTNSNDDFIFENTDYFSLFGNLKIDTYDNRFFPNSGFLLNGTAHWYIGSRGFNDAFESFSIAKADIGYAFSPVGDLSINLSTSGGFKLGDRSTSFLDFAFGGYGQNFINNFGSFYGYDYVSIVGNSFVKADVTFDYEIFKKHHILLSGNFANIADNIFDDGEWFTEPDYTGFALGYSIETFLGPIEAKYTISPELKESYWFFNIGFWF
ncbi:NTE family protein [Winogradskyella wandonensis]|uniref:NTE family protein n=1 Tax=Winogradskyella wandonensis TaxID=1442586 RepID=A0A4R1KSP6_9FLAO|nr:patatin-like phospholipase family protein [Winogradskyella wandonensis]TCK67623.1 NTE family protein [Winogradskyella wandonensis]